MTDDKKIGSTHPGDRDEPQGRLRKTSIRLYAGVLAAAFVVTLMVVKPATPDRIELLTGPEGGAYHDHGLRYAEDLRRRGLEVEVTVTGGALENVQLLAEGRRAVAFAPSSVDWEGDADFDSSHLVALGSVAFEPVWLFHRSGLDVARIDDLAGRVVVSAGRGSASDHVGRSMIERNGLTGAVDLQAIDAPTPRELVESLTAGTIDAVFVTGAVDTPVVAELLGAEGVTFLSLDRAEAYTQTITGVTILVAPEGVFDLARNIPSKDAQLLATTTCLIARDDLHRAVTPMLLVAVENTRPERTGLSSNVTFPSSEFVPLPLHSAARRFYKQGETGLSKYLPYGATRYLNHLGFLVLPLLTLVLVLLKLVPTGLRIWFGLQLNASLRALAAVEKAYAAGDDRSQLLGDLDRIDEATATMFVPRAAVHDFIDFRQFLHDMRERVSP